MNLNTPKTFRYLFVYLILSGMFLVVSYAQGNGEWELIEPAKFRDANGIEFVDENKWILIGGNEINDPISSIFTTEDQGKNWNIVTDNVNAQLMDIEKLSTDNYITVGWAGNILTTHNQGINWSYKTLPGNLGSRNYNNVHFFDENNGIVVGGNPSNDSIQTIITTQDGGESWGIVSDNLGSMLWDIFFLDDYIGYAVGDHNTILKSNDGGQNWNNITISGLQNRSLRSVHFISETIGFIVGGHPSNDSIQTLLTTMDGGQNWDITMDQLGPMLNKVEFYDNQGWILGNNGIMISSSDNGNTWGNLTLPDSINDTLRSLKEVNFYNDDLGIFCGSFGKIILYKNNSIKLPIIETLEAQTLSTEEVELNAWIDANGTFVNARFEYGLDSTMENEINISQNPLDSSFNGLVSEIILGLELEQTYYYRIVCINENGEVVGNIEEFYFGSNQIPNFDFEYWESSIKVNPSEWLSFGEIGITDSYNNTQAIHLQGNENDNVGAIIHGTPTDEGLEGGIYFPHRPDSLVGHFNYKIAADDQALIILQLKNKMGDIIADNLFTLTGSSEGSFERTSFPISYDSDDAIDTLFLGITSTNAFANQNPTSVVILDDIHFVGEDIGPIPNHDFESFETKTEYYPVDWYYNGNDDYNILSRSNDSYHGEYSLKLSRTFTQINLKSEYDSYGPGIKVDHDYKKFNGFYQFYPMNNDTLSIDVTMYFEGQQIAWGNRDITAMVTAFDSFTCNINYFQEGIIPDSANVSIRIKNGDDFENQSDSYALLDFFNFDGLLFSGNDNIQFGSDVIIYPNPSSQHLNVSLSNKDSDKVISAINIYHIDGSKILQKKYDTGSSQQIDITEVANGIYILEIVSQSEKIIKKFIIQK